VTKGWLPQRAGLPGLNSGGAAAVVPPVTMCYVCEHEGFELTEV